MKQKILLFSAVLLFVFSLVGFTSLAIEAKGTDCDCIDFEFLHAPPCPDNHTRVNIILNFSECRGSECYSSYTLRCRCNCCGSITSIGYNHSMDCGACPGGSGGNF